jgi:hypothetical protein
MRSVIVNVPKLRQHELTKFGSAVLPVSSWKSRKCSAVKCVEYVIIGEIAPVLYAQFYARTTALVILLVFELKVVLVQYLLF